MNPFDQLRDDNRPTAPDPRFARRLRARLEAELAPTVELPTRRVTERRTAASDSSDSRSSESKDTSTMSNDADTIATTATARQIITPYISVHDGAAALDWYVSAFGATETVRYVGDDGRLGHAEFVLNGANIMLSDAYPEMGVVAANSYEGSSCALHVEVPDCDAIHAQAVARGAQSLSAPADQPHGARSATIMDPYGHRWMLSQPVRTLSHDEINANYDDFDVVPAPGAGSSTE